MAADATASRASTSTFNMASHGVSVCGTLQHPNLYVYELPSSYRVRGRNARVNDGKNFTIGGNSVFPGPFRLDWMYDVATVFYERALLYQCRVRDPNDAHLFYVPAYNTEMTPHPSSFCAEAPKGSANHHSALFDRLARQAGGALEARGGADHILLTPRPGAYYFESHPLCEFNLLDPRFGSAARLSIEQILPASDLPPRGPYAYHAAPIFISLPYPSWVRLDMDALQASHRVSSPRRASIAGPTLRGPPWGSRHQRSVRVAAVFGVGVGGGKSGPRCIGAGGCTTSLQFRLQLRQRCNERPLGCVYFSVQGANNLGVRSKPTPAHPASTSKFSFNKAAAVLYTNSTFCLMPGGDSATRKATMDALLLGCIPVLFHEGQVQQYPWHWGAWVRNATVLLSYADIAANVTHPIDQLLAVPEAQVQSMQAAIAANAHRMHWATGDTRQPEAGPGIEDAFAVTLRSARVRANSSQLIAEGRATQLRDGAAIEREANLFVNVTSTVGYFEGQCRGSSGAADAISCADTGNASAPWLPPRPLVRTVRTITACIHLCRRCPRCRWISYSLMLQLCTWHHTCDPGLNGSRMDRRYEMWTYRSMQLRSDNATWLGPRPITAS